MTKNKLKNVSIETIRGAIKDEGSVPKAAKKLGVSKVALYEHLEKIGKETFTDLRDKRIER